MSGQTLSVKVSQRFATQFRKFCESHFLQVGKFTEHALSEVMEDYHFGKQAQAVLTQDSAQRVRHRDYLP